MYQHTALPVLVFTGGAAVKAGVQEGDRIIKVSLCHCQMGILKGIYFFLVSLKLMVIFSQVNGSLVSSMSHQEVVKLIKCEFENKAFF